MNGKINLTKNDSGGYVVVTGDHGAGSSGKGSLNSWLADKYEFNMSTNNWMSNAGHYTELDDGQRLLVQHVPSAFVNHNVLLYINAGASIDLDILFKEIKTLEDAGYEISNRLRIHPHANVITQENKDEEKRLLKTGSTFKGCGSSVAKKALRQQKLAKDYEQLSYFICDMTSEICDGLNKGMKILVEGSQGFDLDLNHAEYPYTTSRQTIPAQLVADAGIPFQAVTNVISNLRTNPIRINNVSAADENEICYTGNYWDAKEINWEAVAERAGYDSYEEFLSKYEKSLMTSVTKKIRRVFEFPTNRFNYVNNIIGGNLHSSNVMYSLNFINFVDKDVDGVSSESELFSDRVSKWINTNLGNVKDRIKWIRTGPRHSQIVELPKGAQC